MAEKPAASILQRFYSLSFSIAQKCFCCRTIRR